MMRDPVLMIETHVTCSPLQPCPLTRCLPRWLKTDDGGCYVISRGAFEHPNPPPFNGRAVNVEDTVSGYVIQWVADHSF
jgi:hypothetical protein